MLEKMIRLIASRLWTLWLKVARRTHECVSARWLESAISSLLTSQPDTTPSPAVEARLWGAWRVSTSCMPSLRWDWCLLKAGWPFQTCHLYAHIPSLPIKPLLWVTRSSSQVRRRIEKCNSYFVLQAKELAVYMSQVLQDRQLLSNKALHLFLQTSLSMEVLLTCPQLFPHRWSEITWTAWETMRYWSR